jgi:hypothetical protein
MLAAGMGLMIWLAVDHLDSINTDPKLIFRRTHSY